MLFTRATLITKHYLVLSWWSGLVVSTSASDGLERLVSIICWRGQCIFIHNEVTTLSHVTRTVSGRFAVLWQLRRRSLPDSVFQSLVVALVMPRLDYSKATFVGIPTFKHRQLQSVLNATARLIHRSSRHEHIIPSFRELHWCFCGLGSASISSYPCLSIDACAVSVFTISLIISNVSPATIADVFTLHSSSSLLMRQTRLITVGNLSGGRKLTVCHTSSHQLRLSLFSGIDSNLPIFSFVQALTGTCTRSVV